MKNKKIILPCILVGILISIFIMGIGIFKNDYIYILKFWTTLLMLGITCFPITSLLFKNSHDNGWIFSKIIGLAISSWAIWIISYTKIFKYSVLNSYIIIGIIAVINLIVYLKNKEKIKIDSSKITNILITEIIFVIVLFLWIFFKGMNPAITNSTEKYMDYGYMNSIMNSEYMPPEDIWFSGNTINYYYYGQYISGFLCKIANLKVNEGYNLMVALIGALTFIMPYSIGYDLCSTLVDKKKKILSKVIPVILALIIGYSTCLAGTLHFPIYRFMSKSKEYFYADATRYIGANPETDDKINTEMPAYSTIVGDLHAHYIDLIFSFTVIGILIQYFFAKERRWYYVVVTGFILGLQKMTNYWDLAIYGVIASITIIVKNLIEEKFTLKTLRNIVLSIITLAIVQKIVSFMFDINFNMISTNVFFTGKHSMIYQLLVLWGIPVSCFLTIFIWYFTRFFLQRKENDFLEFAKMNLSDVFILILGACATGLVLIPEILYVKDIYGEEYMRFNTAFKLTYEAFILFAICTNYTIIKLFISKNKALIILGCIISVLQVSTFGYGIDALIYVNNNREYIGIDNSEKELKDYHNSDYLAIKWINENISKDKVILEASSMSSSYGYYSRVSVFSGNPTVFGWFAHQWLWRNEDYKMPSYFPDKVNEITEIYTNPGSEKTKEIIKKYNISYIFIGEVEYNQYGKIDFYEMSKLGEIVYIDNTASYNKTMILKVFESYIKN